MFFSKCKTKSKITTDKISANIDNSSPYRKLQKHMNTFPVGFPESESGADIDILKELYTEEEASIALSISFLPTSIEKIKKRLKKRGIVKKNLEEILEDFHYRGIASRKVSRGESYYSLPQFAIGAYEYQVDRMSKKFAESSKKYMEEEFASELTSTRLPQMRTIPIDISLNPKNNVSEYNQAEKLIQGKTGPFAVANCVCRQNSDIIGKECKHTNIRETCLLFDYTADHWVEMGRARYVNKEEMLRLLRQAQDIGAVLQPTNNENPLAICCCCGCCCGLLTAAKKLPKPIEVFSSDYQAQIDHDKCTGCKLCAKICHMDAIKYDNKKCTVDLDRCIGCGACVPKCRPKAITMQEKRVKNQPFKNIKSLYISILKKKSGYIGILKTLLKQKL